MIYTGRKKISYPLRAEQMGDFKNVIDVINNTIQTHTTNKQDIDYLFGYYKGIQPILNKNKDVREEINNIMVANHAQRITRTICGYFLGTPIQYIQAKDANKEQIEELNRLLSYESKSLTDTQLGENQSICGTAYRLIYTDGLFADEVPFEEKSLHPSTTYVVYENSITEKPLVGVYYFPILNNLGQPIGRHYYVYTEVGVFEFDGLMNSNLTYDTAYVFQPYALGGIPLIEYPNNQHRIGDWELVMSVMDAINNLHSGRLDDVDQIIQSLLVFVNADVDQDTYDEMRRKGVVMLKNLTNSQSSIETISNTLDQNGMNLFAKELENILDTLVGIPSRDMRGGGGGDTGQAVELRDGWADLEIVARNKEAVFKHSEKLALRVILYILKANRVMDLSLKDVDIKFSRNKNHNLLVKTQSYSTLISTQTIHPADCLTIVDLVSDVNEFITRGEAYWEEKKQQAMDEQIALASASKPEGEPQV